MRALVLAIFVVILQEASAWPWSRQETVSLVPSGTIQAQQHTIAECANALQLGEAGDCMFYKCLEDRFRCGTHGYTVNISQHFCDKIDRAYSTFDADGQIWLTQTSVCLMSYMLNIYRSETTTCDAIKSAGITGILECNNRRVQGTQEMIGFCDFIRTNAVRYGNLMGAVERRKLGSLNNVTILNTMVRQGFQCGALMLREAAETIYNRIADAGRDLWESAIGYFGSSS